jgi:hypothetical protein
MAAPTSESCRCGHSLDMHVHARPGSDCSACTGPLQCARFRTVEADGAGLTGARLELPALVG